MVKKITVKERDEARAALRAMLEPGDRVYTILRHVSRSGMSRRISLAIANQDRPGEITLLDWYCERAGLERRHKQHEGLIVGGAGMDMGFHLVYSLGRILWPDGVKEKHDGGYALKHEWL